MGHEPPNWTYYAYCLVIVMVLVGSYFFGVWLRSHVWKGDTALSFGKQLLMAVPVGLITMVIYARSVVYAMLQSPETIVFDAVLAVGNAIIFGMLSRESLGTDIQRREPNIIGTCRTGAAGSSFWEKQEELYS